ncbi:hypothetical protein Sjap_013652 [Stephania japonica]|uniref:Uncharacterized protein n=1 Tax=Stephania japonica TaxID=461633 RepID=A0AAP0IZH9_9MAGN
MAVRKPGLISLFDVYGTLTAPRKVYSDSIYNMKYTIFVAFRLGLVIKHHQARSNASVVVLMEEEDIIVFGFSEIRRIEKLLALITYPPSLKLKKSPVVLPLLLY